MESGGGTDRTIELRHRNGGLSKTPQDGFHSITEAVLHSTIGPTAPHGGRVCADGMEGRPGDGEHSTIAAPIYTLMDRRRVVSASGVARWEYRGRYLDGVASEWASEAESLDNLPCCS